MAKAVHIVQEVDIPSGVDVEIEGMKIRVKGPKGQLERDFSHAKGILIKKENGKVVVEAYFADRRKKALVGTVASHIENMIIGVTKGWRYKLKIITTHFPATVRVVGREVLIENFLGEKAPRRAKIVGDVKISVKGRDIIIEGIDLEAVAQTAANIEQATKVKDKDRRVFVDGIYIYERGIAE